jgi:4-oxalocrotonate tautomerase family enzyme
LKTDYLDIAQLHSCDSEILRQGDCIEGLQRAQEKGYTRYIGYSGDNEEAKLAIEMDVFDAFQTSVNIADQTPIDGNIKLAAEKGLGIIAKRPIANAVWRHKEKPPIRIITNIGTNSEIEIRFSEQINRRSDGDRFAFTMSIPGVDTMIVGTTRPQRWQENAQYVAEGNLVRAKNLKRFAIAGAKSRTKAGLENLGRNDIKIMPYINVKITKDGVTAEQKRRIVEEMTQTLVNVLDKKPEHIHIVIDEIEPENWGYAGMLTTEFRKKSQ